MRGALAKVAAAGNLAIASRSRYCAVLAGLEGARTSLAVATIESSTPIAACSFRVAMIPREILKTIRQIEIRTHRMRNA